MGDSLTAGYGLAAQDGFTARLEAALRARGVAVRVINAGVSGDTSAGGLSRLDWLMSERPDLVIVDLKLKTGHGFSVLKRIRESHPGTKTLVSSMHEETLYAERALKAADDTVRSSAPEFIEGVELTQRELLNAFAKSLA